MNTPTKLLGAAVLSLSSTFANAASEWELGTQPVPPLADIIARPATPLPVYGVYCWADEYLTYRNFIHDVGYKHTRLSGPVDDDVMRAYSEDGMTVMLTIAARRPMTKSADEPARQWRNRSTHTSDEAFIEDYIGDVTRVLERYGPEGTFWKENPELTHRPLQALEVYNEPNFWYLDQNREEHVADLKNPDDNRRLRQEDARQKLYAKFLPAVAKHIKQNWPSIKVVGFGTGGSAYADVRFIKAVHEANPEVAQAYDVLSTHPYTHHVMPEAIAIRSWGRYSQAGSLAEIREIMAAHGAGEKPIWWTELGWGISAEKGGSFDQPNLPGGDKTVSPELHAAYYVRAYARALRLGVERLSLMSLVDTDSFNSGMLNKDGSRRITGDAVANMVRVLPHPKLVGAKSDGTDGVFIYEFQSDANGSDSRNVFMAWQAEGESSYPMDWPTSHATMVSLTGKITKLPASEGKITIPLSPLPVYIHGK